MQINMLGPLLYAGMKRQGLVLEEITVCEEDIQGSK